MLLGSRLVVKPPHYVPFSIRANVEAKPGREPKLIQDAINKQLRLRLALTKTATGASPRLVGVGVTPSDLKVWIRQTDGVARVIRLELRNDAGAVITTVSVPRNGLPKWDAAQSVITVKRAPQGGVR
jgi:hypothetical protein